MRSLWVFAFCLTIGLTEVMGLAQTASAAQGRPCLAELKIMANQWPGGLPSVTLTDEQLFNGNLGGVDGYPGADAVHQNPQALRKFGEFLRSLSLRTFMRGPDTDRYAWGACIAFSIANKLDGSNRGATSAAAPPSQRVQPQPAHVRLGVSPASTPNNTYEKNVRTAKLPPARPARLAPWSPKALSTRRGALSSQFAAQRADALASCSGPIQQWAAVPPVTPMAEANFLFEGQYLKDDEFSKNVDGIKNNVVEAENWGASPNRTPVEIIAGHVGRCLNQRRLAQLEGSPLAAGAVDGSLSPLTAGGSGTSSPTYGNGIHIIGADGRSARDCVALESFANGNSAASGGGRVLINRCSDAVEIGWCYSPGDCDTETGSLWTVQPGRSWPVDAVRNVRWAACHGAGTVSFIKGSYGLRYYCKAPQAQPIERHKRLSECRRPTDC